MSRRSATARLAAPMARFVLLALVATSSSAVFAQPTESDTAPSTAAPSTTAPSTAAPSTTAAPDQDVAAELQQLEGLLDEHEPHVAAATSHDCTSACTAYRAMRRAADRICELQPGQRCQAARARVERNRVTIERACPECVVSPKKGADTPVNNKTPATEPPQSGSAGDKDERQAQPVSAESARGGCAACTAAPARDTSAPGALVWLAAAAAAYFRRRRRHR